MNSYNYSYNVLINRLEAFAAGHLLIKRFTHGQIDLADMDQDEQYPFMHVVPNNIKPVEGGMQFDFQIIFADIPRDKEVKAEYQREVISDCVRLAQDLISEVKNGLVLFGFDVQLVTPPVIEPFMEEYKNTLTGVTFSLQLEVPWDWSACDIPAVWAVGGSSSGGSGSPIGIVLRTNGVDNAVQNILDLVAGTNITITDNGDGSVTFDASGGGGPQVYVSTEYNTNHITALGNPYVIGDRVWYNGSVYACIANNDAINPTNPTYWTLQAVGYRLRQSPVDWNASSGDYQILNKPTIPAAQVNSDWNASSGLAQILNKPTIPSAQVNSDWNSVSGVSEILNKPTIPAAQVNSDWNAVSGVSEILNKPTLNSGTVTSVALTTPAAFTVTGSPVTTSGTLAVTAAGTSSQYIRGDGQLATTPTALPPNGAASGDLTGSYPNPTVHRIHSYDMQSGLPVDGDTWVVVPTPFGTQPVEWRHQKLNVTQLGDTTTVGQNLAKLPNPSAIRYLRVNADNTVSALSASQLISDLGMINNIQLFKDFSVYSVINTSTNTLFQTYAISANSLAVSDFIEIFGHFNTTQASGTLTYRLYINTSANLTGATLLATVAPTLPNGNIYELSRQIAVTAIGASGNLRLPNVNAGLIAGGNTNSLISNIAVNTTVTQYLMFAAQMSVTTATTTQQMVFARINR